MREIILLSMIQNLVFKNHKFLLAGILCTLQLRTVLIAIIKYEAPLHGTRSIAELNFCVHATILSEHSVLIKYPA